MDYENVGPDVDEVLAPLGPWMGVQVRERENAEW